MKTKTNRLFIFLVALLFVSQPNMAQNNFANFAGDPGKARLDSAITIQLDHGSGEWIIHRKREYRYNEAGQMIQSAIDYYDYEENGWLHSRKGEYSWDENDRMVTALFFKKFEPFIELIPYDREDLYYDDQGRLLQVYRQRNEGDSWEYYEREDYVYDESGSLFRIYQYDLEESDDWYPDELQEFTMDSLGRFQFTTYSEYTSGVYHIRNAMDYSFSDNNDLAYLTFYETVYQGYAPVFRYSYTYDDVTKENLTIPYLYPFENMFFNHKIIQADSLSWVAVSQIYVVEARELYYYTGGPSEVNNLSPERSMDVFPNPAGDFCTIDFGDPVMEPVHVSVSDLQGRLVKTWLLVPVQNRIELQIGQLDPGIYLIKSTVNGKQRVARMIKK